MVNTSTRCASAAVRNAAGNFRLELNGKHIARQPRRAQWPECGGRLSCSRGPSFFRTGHRCWMVRRKSCDCFAVARSRVSFARSRVPI